MALIMLLVRPNLEAPWFQFKGIQSAQMKPGGEVKTEQLPVG